MKINQIKSFLLMLFLQKSFLYNVVRKDPFAILAETLKTNQRAACDGDSLQMDCPIGTKISIQLVLYGRSAPSTTVCPPTSMQPRIFTGNEGLNCNIREALRTVEELCQSKQSCSIITSPTSFGVTAYDPCPGVRKYIEVAYKCQPTTFKSRLLCGGESLSLACSEPNQRIALFSSSFKSAGKGPLYCPLRAEYIKESLDYSKDEAGRSMKKCERSDVTQSIIKYCHGEKTCSIKADPLLLGVPACYMQHVLLKTSYACMNELNFLPKFVKQLVTTKVADVSITTRNSLHKVETIMTTVNAMVDSSDNDLLEEVNISEVESIASHRSNNSTRPILHGLSLFNKITSGIYQNFQLVQGNGWKLMLVLTLSTGLGVSCFLILIIIRLFKMYRTKVKTPRQTPSHVNLDSAMQNYEINSQLHTPFPEPKIMQISEEMSTKFSTLTRNRTKSVTKMAPLENYMGEPPKDTVIRYSTIGRNRQNFKTSPIKNDLDSDLADPRSWNTSYENNQLYD